MKITVLYLRVLSKVDPTITPAGLRDYEMGERRFLETYQRFRPAIPHELLVVSRGHLPSSARQGRQSMFDGVATAYQQFDAPGCDCGMYQVVGGGLDSDFVLCCNTMTYFHRPGWLETMVSAAERHGPGVYGMFASYESCPHLRTNLIMFPPAVIRRYPHKVTSRAECLLFENGPENFSLWAIANDLPALLVTADGGCHALPEWRTPPDIFRRGNQSNCLAWDRHCEQYTLMPQEIRTAVEFMANTRSPAPREPCEPDDDVLQ